MSTLSERLLRSGDGQPRITLCVESLAAGAGGIQRVARLTARVLSARSGCTVEIVSLQNFASESFVGLPVKNCGGKRWKFFLALHVAALRSTHFIYDSLAMARAHCRVPGLTRSSLVWIHGIEVWERAVMAKLNAAKRADQLVCNSNYTRTRAAKNHPLVFDRAKVCWLATEQDAAPSHVGGVTKNTTAPGSVECLQNRLVVTIIGRLLADRDKGHGQLISIWHQVCNHVPQAQLRIVGSGPDQALFQQQAIETITANGLPADAIVFTGFVPEDKMPEVWRETDLFCLLSDSEGFGLVYVEAMRYGVPVMGADYDAAGEVIENDQSGWVMPWGDSDQLVEKITYVLLRQPLRARVAESGHRRWAENFRYSDFEFRFGAIVDDFILESGASHQGR